MGFVLACCSQYTHWMRLPPCPSPLFDTLEHLPETAAELNNIKHQEDFDIVLEFLKSYDGSQATYNAYRRELERLIHWTWAVHNTSIDALRREDLVAYIEFCQSPPKTWIGRKTVQRFLTRSGARTPNADWRPFVIPDDRTEHGVLSQSATQAIFSVLSSFFSYAVQEGYVGVNPIAMMRQKGKFLRKQSGHRPVRRLSELQWEVVIETADKMAQEKPAEHERTLFIMSALYGMYLRISELAASDRWIPQMGDFHIDGDGNWWFTTVGKGNKERDISVSDAMLTALKRYRRYRGFSPLPAVGDTAPLIPKTRGRGGISSTRQIRNIVQSCFDQSIETLKSEGFSDEAQQLSNATVHWLRHTGISDDIKHRPREHVREDAGHSTSLTTDRYIDIELRERHASAKRKLINPEQSR